MRFSSTGNTITIDDMAGAVDAAVTLEQPLPVAAEPGTARTGLAREHDALPRLHRARLMNVHPFERLAFMARRQGG